jgi:hypothetical protein
MKSKSTIDRHSSPFWKRALLLLLLLAVPVLSIAAKRSWYLPHANTEHHLTSTVKMKVAHAPVVVHAQPAQLGPTAVSLEPEGYAGLESEPAMLACPIRLVISPQLRAPPPAWLSL